MAAGGGTVVNRKAGGQTRQSGENVVAITRLGAQGDGVADDGAGQSLFVPFTLPGERVRVAALAGATAQPVEIVEPSAQRVTAACRHFTRCGGCQMQHLAVDAYRVWKRQLVIDALAQRGISAEVAPLAGGAPGERRRAVLSARWAREPRLGFHAAASHDLVDIGECPVIAPRLEVLLPDVRRLLALLPRWDEEARVVLLAADNGIDVAIEAPKGAATPGAEALSQIAAAATAARGIVRVTLSGEPIFQRELPVVAAGNARVAPPPGVFLQASRSAERLMADLAAAALPKRAKRVADLFCGIGAFTFRLAERAQVSAIDSDARAVGALQAAARGAAGLKPIEARVRDLFREPLSRKELEGFDAAVLDPPRAGAKAQAEMLAKSKVPLVVAVSCNPATLARDLRLLMDGGYRLEQVTPVDQFHWSAHVEAVAVLRR